MSHDQVQWFADLVTAAEELGYGVVQVAPREIKLASLRAADAVEELTIRSLFLRGDELRRLLRPIRRGAIVNDPPFPGEARS